MLTIWKFPLEVEEAQYIEMPRGARVLSVDVQGGIPCLWAVVDDQNVKDSVLVITYGTGQPMQMDYTKFIGTYQLYGGSFVGHVFIP